MTVESRRPSRRFREIYGTSARQASPSEPTTDGDTSAARLFMVSALSADCYFLSLFLIPEIPHDRRQDRLERVDLGEIDGDEGGGAGRRRRKGRRRQGLVGRERSAGRGRDQGRQVARHAIAAGKGYARQGAELG